MFGKVDMTETYQGAPHTAKTNLEVPLGCPLATYIKEGGGGGRPRRGAPIGGVQLGFPILVGVPSFPRGERGKERKKKERERGRERERETRG